MSTSLQARDEQAMVKSEEVRRWGTLLHLSGFASFIVPILGIAAPVAVWLLKKREAPGLEVHARNLLNGLGSYWIYGIALGILGAVTGPLAILLWPLAGLLGLAGLVAPAVAALKARQGEAWKYPLALPLLETIAGKEDP